MDNVLDQLNLKKDCLGCRIYEERNGNRKNLICFHCGRVCNEMGIYEIKLTKKYVYQEFQNVGITLSDHDIDLVISHCAKQERVLPFGTLLAMILESAIEKRRR